MAVKIQKNKIKTICLFAYDKNAPITKLDTVAPFVANSAQCNSTTSQKTTN